MEVSDDEHLDRKVYETLEIDHAAKSTEDGQHARYLFTRCFGQRWSPRFEDGGRAGQGRGPAVRSVARLCNDELADGHIAESSKDLLPPSG